MSRYCIYLRKSRADLEAEAHGEGETLSRHKTALLELARRMGITISATYEEIVSGETIAARPQMQRLLSEVGAGEWDGVLVMEIERLARGDTMDQGLVAQTFKYSGTKIITPLKTFDPQNEFDEEYFEFGLFMARREFTTTNRRLVRGIGERGQVCRQRSALRVPQSQDSERQGIYSGNHRGTGKGCPHDLRVVCRGRRGQQSKEKNRTVHHCCAPERTRH